MTAGVLPPPGDHGGDGARIAAALGLGVDEVLDLSASLNPVAPPVASVVSKHLDALDRYPDPTAARRALGCAVGVEADRLILTNGGSEAIALVAAEVGRGWVEEPDFSLYRRHIPVVDPTGSRFASNPRNPTGRLAPDGESAGVWDEAFYALSTGKWTRGDADRGSVVVGSLTKLFACPGLRAGYVLCPDVETAERISRRQPAWAVNGLVCAALEELIGAVDLAGTARRVAELRSDLVAVLRRHGLEPSPSDANFVLVEQARGMRDRLARCGVAVRDCTSFGMPDAVRIAVPGGDGLERLEEALGRHL